MTFDFCGNCNFRIRFFEGTEAWMHGPDLNGMYWGWCDSPTLDAIENLDAVRLYPPRIDFVACPEPEMKQRVM